MTAAVDTTYEPFATEPEYIAVNRDFIYGLPIGQPERVLDLACGIGTLSLLLLERLQREGDAVSSVEIIGLDLSFISLDLARRRCAAPPPDRSFEVWVGLAAAQAEMLPLPDACVDAVLIGNAIHMFDKTAVLAEARRILRPSGLLAFNTSFYSGTFAPGTERLYVGWMEEALAYIKRVNADRAARGLPPVTRRRETATRAFAKPWLSPWEYEALLVGQGFTVEAVNQRTVMLTRRSFEFVGAYAGLATVLLGGYAAELASKALMEAAGPALAAAGWEAVPRNWLDIAARRS